ncbi:MAG: hypothetical protein GC160_09990 [Acidobacteria bacterium]|nr:hypothetical protein [Acidobacteriota bacterium]
MAGLGELRSWQTEALLRIRTPERRENLRRLFEQFDLDDARALIEESNMLRHGLAAIQEKGAVGEAVVAATLHHFFATFEGRGDLMLQYELWAGRGVADRYPVRQMDILFLMRTPRSSRGSVAFLIEAKNYVRVTQSTLSSGHLAKQVDKDCKLLNPRIAGHAPVIPVWWFLQGCDPSARSHLEGLCFRVVDFMRDPLLHEMLPAFDVPERLRRSFRD